MFFPLQFPLLLFNAEPLTLDFQPQPPEYRHIKVGYPDQREQSRQIPAPGREQQTISAEKKPERRHIMAQAKLTRQGIEKFTLQQVPAGTAPGRAKFPQLAEN